MAIELLVAALLVAANGFFVLTEFAVTRIRPTQVDDLERAGRAGAKSLRHAVEHIDAYLAACQLGITVSSLGLGVVGERAFHDLLEPVLGEESSFLSFGLAGLVAFSIITLLHVVLGELSPKSVALSRTVPAALAAAPLMRGFYLVTRPLVDLFNGLGNLVLKPFGIPPAREAGHASHSLQELRTIVRESGQEGLLDVDEQQLTQAAFDFGGRRVRDVMRPRVDVVVIGEDEGFDAAARRSVETGLTRLPLVAPHAGLDGVIGIVHAKDLLAVTVDGGSRELRELARPVARVPDAMVIDEALRQLRRERTHIALVLDEHGTAVGVVTVEDIVEELVGEIEDEFDPARPQLVVHEDGAAVVDGSLTLADLAEEMPELRVDEPHEATVGGYVLEHLGRVPDKGEEVAFERFTIEVLDVEETRITRLRLRPGNDAGSG